MSATFELSKDEGWIVAVRTHNLQNIDVETQKFVVVQNYRVQENPV